MTKRKSQKRKPLISALEPRVLFDGAALTTAVDVLDNTSFTDDSTSNDSTTDTTLESTQSTVTMNSGDIFIVTTDVYGYEETAQNLSEQFKVIVLDQSSESLQEDILNATKDLDSELNVHIITANATRDKFFAGSFESTQDLINSLNETVDSKLYEIDTLVEQDLTPSGENEVIIIDESISNYQAILDTIPEGWTVISINSQEDGLTQILEALDGVADLSTVHLFSHGNAGEIIIGDLTLDAQTIESRATDLAKLGQHLSATGDILLYGCDVADGYIGVEFLNLLAEATSADIAASDDATGTYITNADFDLEENVGEIESDTLTVDTNGQVLGSVTTYDIDINRNSSRLYYQASGVAGTGIFTSDNSTWTDDYSDNKTSYWTKIRWETRGWWIFKWKVPIFYTASYSYGAGVRYDTTSITLAHDSEYKITGNISTYLENYLGTYDKNSYAYTNFALYKDSFDKYDPLKNLVTASEGFHSGSIFQGDLEAGNYILVTSFDSWVWWPDSKNWMNLNNYAQQVYGDGTIRVENLNHAPVIGTVSNQTIDGDASKEIVLTQWSNISDADGDEITATVTLSNGNPLPSWLSFNANTLTLTGNPPANTGTITVRLNANDGQETGYQDIQITFTNDNDQPIVSTVIPDQVWNGNGTFSYTIPSDTFTDADPGADVFTYTATLENGSALPSWLSISSDGILSGNPPAGQSDLNIKVTVNDGSGQTNATQSDIFTLKIQNPNDIPVVQDFTTTINEDTTYSFSVNDFKYSDLDTHAYDDTTSGSGKDFQLIRIVELPSNGKLWLDSNENDLFDEGEELSLNETILYADIGKLKYTPNEDWAGNSSLLNGAEIFKWVANDGYDDSNIATTTINVTLLNDAPELSFSQGTTLSVRPNTGDALDSWVKVDAGLSFTDADAVHTDDLSYDTILGAVINLVDGSTGNFQIGDLLRVTDTTNITGVYDSATGTLTLSGAATASEYQQILRSLEFSSTDTSNDHVREVSITLRTVDVGSKNVASFDGIDDYIDTGRASIPMTDDFTVSVWAQADFTASDDGRYNILSQGSTNGNEFILQAYVHDGQIDFWINGATGFTVNDGFPSDGKWHQYTVTREGTVGTLYIDGVQVATGAFTDTVSGTDMRIGQTWRMSNDAEWGAEYWKGSISDIRIYNDILSQTEILESINTSKSLTGYEANLVAWYPLETDFENKAVTSWSLGRDFDPLNGDGIDGAWSIGYLDYSSNTATLEYQTFTAYDSSNTLVDVADNGFTFIKSADRHYYDTIDGQPLFSFNDGYEASTDASQLDPGIVRVLAGYINPGAIEFTAQVSGVYEVDARFWDGHDITTNSMAKYEVYKVDASGNLIAIVGSETTIAQNSTPLNSISNLQQVQLDAGEKLVFAVHKGDNGVVSGDEIFTDINVNLIAAKTTVSGQDYYYNLKTGHYLAISQTNATWENAKTAAESMTLNGESGYLATPIDDTSLKIMRALMFEKGNGTAFLGAAQSQSSVFPDNSTDTYDDGWFWASGPNEGKVFDGIWMTGEPNNVGVDGEDVIGLNWNADSIDGYNAAGYNDFNANSEYQYFIEFGDNPLDVPNELQTALAGTQEGNALVFVDSNTVYSSQTGHYYKISTAGKDFDSAMSSAEASTYEDESGYLTRISDSTELSIIGKLVDLSNSSGVWVGAQNVTASDGTIDWKWVDSNGVVSDYDSTQYYQELDTKTQLEISGWTRVDYDDFSHGNTGWKYVDNNSAVHITSEALMGQYNSTNYANRPIYKDFDINNQATTITYTFNRLDSWDTGENYLLDLNGTRIFTLPFQVDTEITSPITGVVDGVKYTLNPVNYSNFYGNSWADQSFEVILEIPEGYADNLKVRMDTSLTSSSSDENYSIDNFTLWQKLGDNAINGFDNGTYGWTNAGSPDEYGTLNITNPDYGNVLWFNAWEPQKNFIINNEATNVEFDILTLDTWDGESFYGYINNESLFDFSRVYTVNYTEEVSGTATIDGKTVNYTITPQNDYGNFSGSTTSYNDQSFHIKIEIPDNFGSDFDIKLGTTLNQDRNDESIGLDNFTVYKTNTTYENIDTFENGDATGWSDAINNDGIYYGSTNVENYGDVLWFRAWDPQKTFFIDNKATKVEFDLITLDSWDNERFYAYINDTTIINFQRSGNIDQTETTNGSVVINGKTLNYTIIPNDDYGSMITSVDGQNYGYLEQSFHIIIDIPENFGESFELKFNSNLDESPSNESVGIDNVKVYSVETAAYVDANGVLQSGVDNQYSVNYDFINLQNFEIKQFYDQFNNSWGRNDWQDIYGIATDGNKLYVNFAGDLLVTNMDGVFLERHNNIPGLGTHTSSLTYAGGYLYFRNSNVTETSSDDVIYRISTTNWSSKAVTIDSSYPLLNGDTWLRGPIFSTPDGRLAVLSNDNGTTRTVRYYDVSSDGLTLTWDSDLTLRDNKTFSWIDDLHGVTTDGDYIYIMDYDGNYSSDYKIYEVSTGNLAYDGTGETLTNTSIDGTFNPTHFTYDPIGDRIYWSDYLGSHFGRTVSDPFAFNEYSNRASIIEYGAENQTLSAPLFTTLTSSLPDKYITQTKDIVVRVGNTAPVVNDWTISLDEDSTYLFKASEFKANYDDPEYDSIATLTIKTLPSAGVLELNGVEVNVDDSIAYGDLDKLTFVPNTDANGNMTFTYIVSDGNLDSNISTVTITVNAKNDAPVINTTNTYTLNPINEDVEDASNTGTLVSDLIPDGSIIDVDGSAVEAIAVTKVNNSNGIWQYSIDSGSNWSNITNTIGSIINIESNALLLDSDSLVRFVPNENYNGTSNITFRAWDKSGSQIAGDTTNVNAVGGNTIVSVDSVTANITINAVNDAPETLDKTITMDEDSVYTFTLDDFAFSDIDNTELASITISNVQGSGTLSSSSNVTKAQIEAGLLTFTPVADAYGNDYATFNFIVNDGTDDSTVKTITINVNDTNDAPTAISWASGGTIAEDAISTSSTPTEVGKLEATDPDTGDSLRFVQLSNDKFIINPDGSIELAISPVYTDSNNTEVNVALLDYELNPTETIRVKVIDSQGLSYEKDIVVNVTDVIETAPSLYTNTFYIEKNQTVTITELNLNTIDADTLDKDLVYTVTQFPSGGKFFIDNDGDDVYDLGVDYLLAPESEDMPEHVETFTQADIISGKLKFAKDDTQTAGKLTFNVTDGTTTKEGVLVGITSSAPELASAIDDQTWKTSNLQTFKVPASTFFDADYDVLTLSTSSLPSWLTFDSQTNTFSGTPTGVSDGDTLSITVTATDGRTTPVSDTFVITFKDAVVNPIIENPLPNYVEFDGSGEKTYQVPVDTFSDPTTNGLTYTATLGDGSPLPSWLSFDEATRTFSGNPPASVSSEPIYIKLTADNSSSTTSTTFKLYVSNPNDIPTVSTLADQLIVGTSEKTFTILKSAFSDADGDDITLSLITSDGSDLPSWISYRTDSNGNLVVTATAPGPSGSIDLVALGSDGFGGDAEGAFTLNYSGGVNQAPQVATADGIYYMDGSNLELNNNSKLSSFSIIEGQTLTITTDYLDERDDDDDGKYLTFTVTTLPTKGVLEIWKDTNGNGKADTLDKVIGVDTFTFTAQDLKDGLIQYKHTANDSVNDSFVFSLKDNDNAVVSGVTFDITVNDAPPEPKLLEITRYGSDELTNQDSVIFKLKFSEPVFGLDTGDINVLFDDNIVTTSDITVTDITASGSGEYLITVSGADIKDANGTLGLALNSSADIFSGSTRTTLDPDQAIDISEQYTLDNIGPKASFARSGENDIIITFNEETAGELTLDELSIDVGASLSNLVKLSANSYKVTITREDGNTNDPILTLAANSVTDNAQNYNGEATYTIKGSIDLTSNDDWVPLLVGDMYDPNDDVQSNKSGVDIVGNADNPLLYTQYNGTELAFRIRQEDALSTNGIFYLMGVDENLDGALDFFIGIEMPKNSKDTPVVSFFEAGSGTNDAPNTTSFNTSSAVEATGTQVEITEAGTDLDSDENDGFISFKFNAAAFENYVNDLLHGGASTYTVDSKVGFVLVTATQTNSINGDIGGRDGNDNQPWGDLLTPTVFSNTAPISSDSTIDMIENSVHTFTTNDFNFSDADGDTLNSVIITKLPTNGVLTLNGEYVTLNQEISESDITSGNLKFTPETNKAGENYSSFDYKVNDGKSNSAQSYTITFDVEDVNDAPIISNFDGDVQYWSNSNEAVPLDPFTYAVISDSDELDFNNGVLTISVSGGTSNDNRLSVIDNGNITISENEISYSGTLIGTINNTNDGSYGSDLVITFNSEATQEKITELVQALRFTYEGDEFISPIRTITMEITDGDGGTSNTATLTMVGPPVYQVNGYEDVVKTFVKEDYNISTDVKITDLNSNNGTWYYLDSSNSNTKTQLTENTQITAAEFDTLTYEPNQDIYGNGLDSLSYKSVGTANSVGFDSTGLSYVQPTLIINLDPVNDGAVIDLNGIETGVNTTATYKEINGADNSSNDVYLTNGYVSISDVDDTTLEALKLTANAFSGDELIIGDTKLSLTQNTSGTITVSGQTYNYSVQYGSDSAIIEFTSSAIDSEKYETLLNSIKFNNSSDTPNETDRVFNISVNDGKGFADSVTSTVSVVAVNDSPTMNDIKISSYYDWNLDLDTTLVPSITLGDIDGAITTVTLTINGLQEGDSLNFTDAGNVTGSFVNGVLTLTNTGSTADMQAALRTVTFNSTVDSDGTRFIDIVATDNDNASTNIGTTRVDLVNNTPSIDLDDASDTGVSSKDNITNDDTPTFTITLPTVYTANSILKLFDSNGNEIGSVTVQPNQTTATITVSQRPGGLQTIVAQVIDAGTDRSKDSSQTDIEIYVDKTAPTFEANQTIKYVENQSAGDILGKVEVSDLSGIESFTITSGNTNNWFTIDNDGNITLTATGAGAVASNDFETLANSFGLTIEVKDNAGNTTSKIVTLEVTNEDEEVPVFNTTTYNYAENQGLNSIVATLDATDDIGIVSYKFKHSDNSYSSTSEDGFYTIDNEGNIKITEAGIASNMNDFENGLNSGNYTIQISDLVGNDVESTITLNVTDINDAPTLNNIAVGTVTDNTTGDSTKSNLSGTLAGNDEDSGDTLTYSIADEVSSSETGFDKKVVGTYGTLHINSSTGAYEFIVDEAKVDELGPDDSYTENFNLTVTDNGTGNLNDTKTLTINIIGANDAPTLEIVDTVEIVEDPKDPTGDPIDNTQDSNLSGNISFNDSDKPNDVIDITFVTKTSPVWSAGTIDSTLATNLEDAFSVVTLTDSTIPGATTWAFDIAGVDLTFLNTGETITFSYDVTATDSNSESTTKTISFTINGQASTPIITSTNTEGVVVEAGGVLNATVGTNSVSKTLTAVDSDSTEFAWTGDATGNYGDFKINPTSGQWTYTLDNSNTDVQALQLGDTLTESFTVTVADDTADTPNTDTQIVKITIKGANDNPVLSTITAETYTDTNADDTFAAKTGTLSSSDVDADDTKTYSILSATTSSLNGYDKTISGTYGILHFNSETGNYKYIPNDAAIEAASGDETDTFSFVVTDSQNATDTQDLVINISGVNDDLTILNPTEGIGDSVTKYETNSPIKSSGELIISDSDLLQTLSASVTSTSATLNSVSNSDYTDASNWLTFTNANVLDATEITDSLIWKFDSGTENFNSLSAGDELVFTYTIQVTDGTNPISKDITVKIIGTNDAPILTIDDGDNSTGDITENDSSNRTVTGQFTVIEEELGDTLTTSITNVSVSPDSTAPSELIPTQAELLSMISLGSQTYLADTSTSSDSLTWTFNSGAKTFDGLAKNETIVIDYTLKVTDGVVDLYDTIKITIKGTDDRFTVSTHTSEADDLKADVESGEDLSTHKGTLDFNDIDTTDRITISERLKSITGSKRDGSPLNITSSDKTNIENAFSITLNENIDDPNNGTIDWDYLIAQTDLDFLGAGESIKAVFEILATDKHGNEIAKDVTITIAGENKTPVITGTNTASLTETDTTLSDTVTLTASDLNVTDTLTAEVVSGTIQRSNGTVLAMTEEQLSWLSLNNYKVVDNTISSDTMPWEFNSSDEYFDNLSTEETLTLVYTVKVTDDAPIKGSDTETITITIQGTNDAPIAVEDKQLSTDAETTLTMDVLGNDTDIDALDDSTNYSIDSVQILSKTHNQNGYVAGDVTNAASLSIVNNKIVFNPGNEYRYLSSFQSETVEFEYTMSDDEGLTSKIKNSITVNGYNYQPIVNTLDVIDEKLNFGEKIISKDVSGLFKDTNVNDTLTFSAINLPNGFTIDPNTGIISGQAKQSGKFNVEIIATDNGTPSLNNSRVFVFEVIAPPQPPAEPTNDGGGNVNDPLDPAKQIKTDIEVNTSNDIIINEPTLGDDNNTEDGQNAFGFGFGDINLGGTNDTPQNLENTELTSLATNNNNNPNDRIVSAGVELNVSTDGQVNFSQETQESFETVGMAIEMSPIVDNNVRVQIVDTRVGQKYTVTLTDDSPLPEFLIFDPNTGQISGEIPEELEELEIKISARAADGTTRELIIKLDIKALKENSQNNQTSFETLSEQINAQNEKMNNYGDFVTQLFAV